jgi:hypothetical protein
MTPSPVDRAAIHARESSAPVPPFVLRERVHSMAHAIVSGNPANMSEIEPNQAVGCRFCDALRPELAASLRSNGPACG